MDGGAAGPFGPMAVIADPRAGQGRVAAEMQALERGLARRGLEHRLLVAAEPGDTTRLARAAMRDGHRYLVAVGDDGTVQAVLNGMMDGGGSADERPVLAVVGANSGCDLLRSFGLPGDVDAALDHLFGGNTYPLDVIELSYAGLDGGPATRYVHNLAEAGLGAEVTRRVARLPAGLGRARRFLAFWLGLARTKPFGVRVRADRATYEGPAFNVVVANAQFTSGGLRLSPRSFPGDGVIEVLAFVGPRSDAYTMLPRIYRHGDHVPDPNVRELRAKVDVSLDADRPLPIVADGELLGFTPATFHVMPGSILLKL